MTAELRFADGGWHGPVMPPNVVGSLLMHLMAHDFRSIDAVVAPALGLPRWREAAKHDCSHGKRGAGSGGAEGGRKPMRLCRQCCRSINKALSMELLCAQHLAHLNSADFVTAHCELRSGRPHSFAGSGKPDLVAEYSDVEHGQPFLVVGEVSAKRQVTKAHFQKQLGQALRRSRELAKERPGCRVYGLTLNGGDIGHDEQVRSWYLDFIERNNVRDDPAVRILPMNAWDAAWTMSKLDLHGDGLNFASGQLAQAFDDMIDCLEQPEPPTQEGWMAEMLVDAALGEPQLTGDGGGSGGPP